MVIAWSFIVYVEEEHLFDGWCGDAEHLNVLVLAYVGLGSGNEVGVCVADVCYSAWCMLCLTQEYSKGRMGDGEVGGGVFVCPYPWLLDNDNVCGVLSCVEASVHGRC